MQFGRRRIPVDGRIFFVYGEINSNSLKGQYKLDGTQQAAINGSASACSYLDLCAFDPKSNQ